MKFFRYSAFVLGCLPTLMNPTVTQADEGDIGYPTVTAAREALLSREDVKMSTENGWLTIEDPVAMTLWTFTPESDAAHPAAIKRSVIQDGERIVIRMDIRCEGDAAACDALENHFLSLNEGVRDRANTPEDRQPSAAESADGDKMDDDGG